MPCNTLSQLFALSAIVLHHACGLVALRARTCTCSALALRKETPLAELRYFVHTEQVPLFAAEQETSSPPAHVNFDFDVILCFPLVFSSFLRVGRCCFWWRYSVLRNIQQVLGRYLSSEEEGEKKGRKKRPKRLYLIEATRYERGKSPRIVS